MIRLLNFSSTVWRVVELHEHSFLTIFVPLDQVTETWTVRMLRDGTALNDAWL
jgi:hypothetical protein